MPAPTLTPIAFAPVEDGQISFTYTVSTSETYVTSVSAASNIPGVASGDAEGSIAAVCRYTVISSSRII
jgi:hypothetical protein